MPLSDQLTGLQKRILIAMPVKGSSILLRRLANRLEMSSNQVRIQVRNLERLGYLLVEQSDGYNPPLEVSLVNLKVEEKPNFDKLLFSSKWS